MLKAKTKFLLLGILASHLFGFNLGFFVKNYIVIKPNETLKQVLTELNDVAEYQYFLEKPKNYFLKVPSPKQGDFTRVYNLEGLNKYLIKHRSRYILMFDYRIGDKIYLKVVPANYLDDYYVKGVRLYNETLKDVIKKLNKQRYAKIIYLGRDFKIPNNPSVTIKNIQELKNYLDMTSYRTIKITKVEDLDHNGIIDTIYIKEKDNIVPGSFSPMQSTIYYLQHTIDAAEKIKNPNFAKRTFINNIKSIIKDLKNL